MTSTESDSSISNHAMLNDIVPNGLSALLLENASINSNVVCVSQRECFIDDENVCVSPKNESLGDTAHCTLSDSDNEDLPDIHILYTKTLKKSTKLEKVVKDLTQNIASLSQMIKQNAKSTPLNV